MRSRSCIAIGSAAITTSGPASLPGLSLHSTIMPVLEPSPPVLVPAVLVPAAVVPAAVVSAAVVPVVVEVLSAGSPVLSAPVGPELPVLTGSLVASPPVGGPGREGARGRGRVGVRRSAVVGAGGEQQEHGEQRRSTGGHDPNAIAIAGAARGARAGRASLGLRMWA